LSPTAALSAYGLIERGYGGYGGLTPIFFGFISDYPPYPPYPRSIDIFIIANTYFRIHNCKPICHSSSAFLGDEKDCGAENPVEH
jgi:hypothetical protein